MDFNHLTDDELKKYLILYNIPIVPITPTTKGILIHKLKKKFDEINGNGFNNSVTFDPINDQNNEPLSVSTYSADSTQNNLNSSFYGIVKPFNNMTPNIVRTLKEAVKVAKSSPGSRFKEFKTFEEAESFSNNPFDSLLSNSSPKILESADPTSIFPSIKPIEFIKFKNFIAIGDLENIKILINKNPKYLISASDIPTIIQDGFHRNSLHLAAFYDQPEILIYILFKLKDFKWLQNYFKYKKDIKFNLSAISDRLLDLYLNTPDKAQETVLHIASKYGFYSIVNILLTEIHLDRGIMNGFQMIAEEVICSRCNSNAPEGLKENIKLAFQNSWFFTLKSENSHYYFVDPPLQKITSSKSIISVIGPINDIMVSNISQLLQFEQLDSNLINFLRSLAVKYGLGYKERFLFFGGLVNINGFEGFHMLDEYFEAQANSVDLANACKDTFNHEKIIQHRRTNSQAIDIHDLSGDFDALDLADDNLSQSFIEACTVPSSVPIARTSFDDPIEIEQVNQALSIIINKNIPKDKFLHLWLTLQCFQA